MNKHTIGATEMYSVIRNIIVDAQIIRRYCARYSVTMATTSFLTNLTESHIRSQWTLASDEERRSLCVPKINRYFVACASSLKRLSVITTQPVGRKELILYILYIRSIRTIPKEPYYVYIRVYEWTAAHCNDTISSSMFIRI